MRAAGAKIFGYFFLYFVKNRPLFFSSPKIFAYRPTVPFIANLGEIGDEIAHLAALEQSRGRVLYNENGKIFVSLKNHKWSSH